MQLALAREPLPVLDELVGAPHGIGAQLGLELERANRAPAGARRALGGKAMILGIGRLGIAPAKGPYLVEPLTRTLQRADLVGTGFAAALARCVDCIHR